MFKRAEQISGCLGEQASKETYGFWFLLAFRIDSSLQDEKLTQFLLSVESHPMYLEKQHFEEGDPSVLHVFLNFNFLFT